MYTPLRCRYCRKRISRSEARLWDFCCDQCASRPEGTTPAQRAYAAHLLRRTLAHARGETPLITDHQGRHYLFVALA